MWIWISVRISPLATPKTPEGGVDQQWAANFTSPDYCLASGTSQAGSRKPLGREEGGDAR